MSKTLLILGCSATKRQVDKTLPAIYLYDGPLYRTLRKYLRENRFWPEKLSVAVLSAKHKLIGGIAPITTYDQKMTEERATEMQGSVASILGSWKDEHDTVSAVVGQSYAKCFNNNESVKIEPGPIGQQNAYVSELLKKLDVAPIERGQYIQKDNPIYFLPDWDDFVDKDYDFKKDEFSAEKRSERNQTHVSNLTNPNPLCSGILVSLAQQTGSKGFLKSFSATSKKSLAPKCVREYFDLPSNRLVFGDCGAYSYAAEENPLVTVEQAVSIYDLYGFNWGASVDHIPIKKIKTANGWKTLSSTERKRRIILTRNNADKFIKTHKEYHAQFTPVGIIQGIVAKDYAEQIGEYLEMGYKNLALGGLVPRSDAEISKIVLAVKKSVAKALEKKQEPPNIHLFGVYRPNLREVFQECNINSFDSATYFRKAWMERGRNYLGVDQKWYAAIRVPQFANPNTNKRFLLAGKSKAKIEQLERSALRALREYDKKRIGLEKCLDAVLEYDAFLPRRKPMANIKEIYKKTLIARPWEKCTCPLCQDLGIQIIIFRGGNRNRRRGAHNTHILYQSLKTT